MNDSLMHRGPDGGGFFTAPGIGLGHRRLSIIDLEGGDQPIYNEDNSIVIVFNGEIYNYRELREDLIAKGHAFKTHSDTEVIVHLYEEEGTDCVLKLNGMFAFAIWDKNKQRLFCARDRFGEKPFYYTVNQGVLYFASELKTIKLTPNFDPSIDLSAVDDYLAYGYIPAPQSIYKNVSKLSAANYLVWEAGNLHIKRYWSPSFPAEPIKIEEEEAVHQLRSLINDSIKLRLRSDVPVGAFLSGGIDSSLMVALATQQTDQTISTFSVGFSERDFDELGSAKVIADQYNTNHHEIMVDSLDLSLFPKIVAHFDEPFGDASAIPTYYVTQAAAEHVKVCISGDAGDEFFCGYTRYRYEPFEQYVDLVPEGIRKAALGAIASVIPDHIRGKGRLRRYAVSGHQRYQRMIGPFDPTERVQLFRPEYQKHIDKKATYIEPYFSKNSRLDPISQRMHADQLTYLSDDILVKVDRDSMWHSLEVRVPFLDHRITDFANSLPYHIKNKNGNQKYLLKQILKDLAPEEITTRAKKGFGLPLVHWFRDRFSTFSEELMLSNDSFSNQFFEPNKIKSLIDGHNKGHRDLSRRIWTLLWFEQWCRLNLK
jgi:asparagine synthase (glutamine-hydrolysing)